MWFLNLARTFLPLMPLSASGRTPSFPINRIPLDVLALIPTHLTSHKDRFRTSFVCRHWRRVFLQRGVLWSQLFIRNGEDYIETLLERAKGSALDIFTKHKIPTYAITQLAPHAQQIRHLEFLDTDWADIKTFSEVPGALPLLHTLKIIESDNDLDPVPSHPLLFHGSLNLEQFILHSVTSPLLRLFLFPNLTTFKFTTPGSDYYIFDLLPLLEFLKISPTLRTIKLDMFATIMLDSVSQGVVIVLPNVETFSLSTHELDGTLYDIAAHISCPCAKLTSLRHKLDREEIIAEAGLFPTSALWNTLVHQYTTNQIEEVTIAASPLGSRVTATIKYTLSFQSSDATVIRLGFRVTDIVADEEELELSWEQMNLEVFSQACRTIQDHPLFSRVKRLHINLGRNGYFHPKYVASKAKLVGEMLGSLGSLDEVILHSDDVPIFTPPFPHSFSFERGLPPIKKLTISEPLMLDSMDMDRIVQLAKSLHEPGKPFERITFPVQSWISSNMAEALRQWVSTANCWCTEE